MPDFSFNGVNISRYGLYYAPDTPGWHIWEPRYSTISKSVESQHGGQWYDTNVQPKEFDLRCYFENMTETNLAMALGLFPRGMRGPLVFDERNWITYDVRVVKPPSVNKHPAKGGTYSGIMTIALTAFYPFGTSELNTLADVRPMDDDVNTIISTTGLIEQATMPVNPVATSAAPLDNQFVWLANNAGDEVADTIVRIAGDVGNGVIMHNADTNQTCKAIGLTKANTTNVGRWLEIHSKTGECFLTDGINKSKAYYMHDNGYLKLVPSAPILRAVSIHYENNKITLPNTGWHQLSFAEKGSSVRINNDWARINTIESSTSAFVDKAYETAGDTVSDILRLNKIVVTPTSTMSLTRFEIVHKNTFK